jgi:hypothetical protein
MLLLIVLFASFAFVSAQGLALTETYVSSDGVSFLYPDGYTVSEQGPLNYVAESEDDSSLIIVLIDAGLADSLDFIPTTIEEAYAGFEESLAELDVTFSVDERRIYKINDAAAVQQEFTSPDDEQASLLIFELPDGRIAVVLGVELEGMIPGPDGLVAQIARSVTLEGAAESASTSDALPDGPLTADQMPANTLILTVEDQRSQLTLPESWGLLDTTTPVEGNAVLTHADSPSTMISVSDYGPTTGIDRAFFETTILPTLAAIYGVSEFNVDEARVSVPLEDGRVIEAYPFEPDDSTSLSATAGLFVVVELADGHYGSLQAQGLASSLPESFADDVLAIASSFTEFGAQEAVVDAPADEPAAAMSADCFMAANQFIDDSNTSALIACPADCANGSVWGTDTYTLDSSVCTAAVHAGINTLAGGIVAIEYAPGLSEYAGTMRNGVTTNRWGSYGDSFVITEQVEAADANVMVDCSILGYDVVNADLTSAVINCPANCGIEVNVWGTDIYTNDSNVCVAAIHAGVITLDGGPVLVELAAGQDSYSGSVRNGIETRQYGSWHESFTVSTP